jgi:hypothetical protein
VQWQRVATHRNAAALRSTYRQGKGRATFCEAKEKHGWAWQRNGEAKKCEGIAMPGASTAKQSDFLRKEVKHMNQLAKRAQIKDLSNKAEGIFHFVGKDNVLFRLISTGNELTSDINHAVALFTNFARYEKLGDQETRSVINGIYRRVGKLMCLIDIIHAAAGEQIMPEPYESIDFCYMNEYRTLLREAVIKGMPDNYKGPQQNPFQVRLVKPSIAYGADYQPDEYDDDFFTNFVRKEEPRDRKLVFRCTKSELESIMRYANIIDVKFTEEEIHHG